MASDRAKKKHERELKRRRHRRDVRIDASLRVDPEKKPKVTSWKVLIEDIIAETAQLLGIYNDLKRIYKARMVFARNKRAEDPSAFSDARFEEYENFGKEIDDLNDTVHKLVTLTATLEDREDTRERMDFFFEHMDEFNDGREKFASTMSKMQALDEHFIEDMKKITETVHKVEATDEIFPDNEGEDEVIKEATVVEEPAEDVTEVTEVVDADEEPVDAVEIDKTVTTEVADPVNPQ